MTAIRYTSAGHVLRFFEKVRPQFQGKERPFVDLIAAAFDCGAWDERCVEVQLGVQRHLDRCISFIEASEETKDAKRVFLEALHRLKAAFSIRSAMGGWQAAKQAIDLDKNQLIVINSLMRSQGVVEYDLERVDDLERRLREALDELMEAGADSALLKRFREVVDALLFGLRNADVLGADMAWEKASTLIAEVAASAPDLKGRGRLVSAAKGLAAAAAVALTTIHATRVTTDDVLAIMSNVEQIGAHALEWEERLLIEDKRPNKGASGATDAGEKPDA